MTNKREIRFSISKEKAIKVAKKAASSKLAITNDDGAAFTVGAPSMKALVEVGEGVIRIYDIGVTASTADTIYELIEKAIEEAQDHDYDLASRTVARINVDDQLKIVDAIKGFKELLDAGIISQEEFDYKKKELLQANGQSVEKTQQIFPRQKESPSVCNDDERKENTEEKETHTIYNQQAINDKQERLKKINNTSLIFLGANIIIAIAVIVLMLVFPFCRVETKSSSYFTYSYVVHGTTALFGGKEHEYYLSGGKWKPEESFRYDFYPSPLTLISWILIIIGAILSIYIVVMRLLKKEKQLLNGIMNLFAAICFATSAILILISETNPLYPIKYAILFTKAPYWRDPSLPVEWILILTNAVFAVFPTVAAFKMNNDKNKKDV